MLAAHLPSVEACQEFSMQDTLDLKKQAKGTKRRFPPKSIENTFYAIQNGFRSPQEPIKFDGPLITRNTF